MTDRAVIRRLREIESMAWVLRLLLDGAKVRGVVPGSVQAEEERSARSFQTIGGRDVVPSTDVSDFPIKPFWEVENSEVINGHQARKFTRVPELLIVVANG